MMYLLVIRLQSKNIFLSNPQSWKFKNTFIFSFLRISVDDVRAKLSSNSKTKIVTKKLVDKTNESDDLDDFELGNDINDEKNRKA